MQTTFEQVIEAAQGLSPEDLKKLGEWTRQHIPTSIFNPPGAEEELNKYRAAREWIDVHRDRYAGQWVCLDGNKLISHGNDPRTVQQEAKARGIDIPFVVQIVGEPEFYGGGIEICQ